MEIFTGNFEVIKKDIDRLIRSIPNIKSDEEALYIFYALYPLLSECENGLSINTNQYEKIMKKDLILYLRINKKSDMLNNCIIENFIKYKDFNIFFANKVCKMLNRRLRATDDYLCEDTNLSMKEQYEIMMDFFKEYGNIGGTILDRLIKEGRIFNIGSYDEFYDDTFVILNKYLENESMYINKSTDDIDTMTSIVHELGHIIDFHNLLEVYSNRDMLMYGTTGSPYIEVESKKYEKAFLEYLIRNNIYPKNAKYQLDRYYYSILDSAKNQLVLLGLSNIYLRNERYKRLPLGVLLHNLSRNKCPLINNDESLVVKELNIRVEYACVYSGAIATYLSHIEKEDEEKYRRVSKNFERHKLKLFNPRIFEVLETTPCGIIDIISKEMKILDKPKVKNKKP